MINDAVQKKESKAKQLHYFDNVDLESLPF